MIKKWTHSNKAIFNIGYHLIWCTKYRRPMLKLEIKKRLRFLLLEKAKEIGVNIADLEIMPEHVHMFVKCSPVDPPHFIVQQFKGYTSHTMRKEFSELRTRVPTLWTRSYYYESVGHISENTVKKYIEDQKNK